MRNERSNRRKHAIWSWKALLGIASLTFTASLNPASAADVSFQKIVIDKAFRAEGVAVADVNRDGKLDIIAGNVWYAGPDWKMTAMLGVPKEYPQKAYSDAFLCFPEDITGDGYIDLVVVGFPGQKTRWLQNPGAAGGTWSEHLAIEQTGNESPWWIDADGDGKNELVFTNDGRVAFARPGEDPTKIWPIQHISEPGKPAPGHGIGVGDVNGDGRSDVVVPQGWYEGPAKKSDEAWAFHPAKLSETPAQLCVYDFDGDGDSDLLSSAAHGYGIWWAEQGSNGWTMHEIGADQRFSQTHAIHLADINGDGLMDFVTGKRFWAHNGGDPGSAEPVYLRWYELQRKEGRPVWTIHQIDEGSGVGLHFQIVDMNGDGRLDIITANKRGVHLFLQK